MAGRSSAARLTAALEHVAVVGADDRVLRARLLEVIGASVPFDAYAFLLTDPVTSVGCSPLAEVPDLGGAPDLAALPDLIRLKYLTSVNRWTGLPASGCATLQQTTGGRLEESLWWREHLSRLGVLDVLSVVFRDRHGWWGFLDLWRRETCFTHDEAAALSGARHAITARLREVQAAGFTAAAAFPDHRAPGVLVLSPALAIRAQTAQTHDWLRALVPPQDARSPVPASAYNVAAQLLAVEAGVDASASQARVHLGGGSWLTLRADRLGGRGPVEHRDIVVSMEASTPTERRDVFSRACGLTSRESEVLRHLADGLDTRALAQVLGISELTVQDHLKAVFVKTGTSSRRELLATSGGR